MEQMAWEVSAGMPPARVASTCASNQPIISRDDEQRHSQFFTSLKDQKPLGSFRFLSLMLSQSWHAHQPDLRQRCNPGWPDPYPAWARCPAQCIASGVLYCLGDIIVEKTGQFRAVLRLPVGKHHRNGADDLYLGMVFLGVFFDALCRVPAIGGYFI